MHIEHPRAYAETKNLFLRYESGKMFLEYDSGVYQLFMESPALHFRNNRNSNPPYSVIEPDFSPLPTAELIELGTLVLTHPSVLESRYTCLHLIHRGNRITIFRNGDSIILE